MSGELMTPAAQPQQFDLFSTAPAAPAPRGCLQLEPGAVLLQAFAFDEAPLLLVGIEQLAQQSPWRHMATSRGGRMSVAMTNCGAAGWVSDGRGYRYSTTDPQTQAPWPALPAAFAHLAKRAAQAAGFAHFEPDVCLVNRYLPGAGMALHQDRDEKSFDHPIVSVSLGVLATFLWGGATRAHKPHKLLLHHGDVVVWGGPARLNFHGVDVLRTHVHELTGNVRYNLTFRRAL